MLNPIQRYFPKLHRFLSTSAEADLDRSLAPEKEITLYSMQSITSRQPDQTAARNSRPDQLRSPDYLPFDRSDHPPIPSILSPFDLPELLTQGHNLLMQGQLEAAIAHYRYILRLDPASGEAYQYLAEALSQQGELQESAACYRRAIELSTASSLQKTPAVKIAVLPNAWSQTEEDEELSWFEEAAFYVQQGDVLGNLGNWAEAIEASQRAIELLEPQLAAAYITAGRAWQHQDNLDRAEQTYEKAIAIQPQSAVAHARLASLYTQQQCLTQAIAYYQQAIVLDPQFAGAYWKLAEVWHQMGDAEKAATHWYQALQLQPTWATPPEYVKLGNWLRQQEKLDGAIACYRQAIQGDATLAMAYHYLGETLGQQGDWAAAVEAHRQAVLQDAQSAQFYAGLGQALMVSEQWQEAAVCYGQVTRLAPDQHLGYLGLRDALVTQERWQEALLCYQKLVELQPSGKTYHELGDAYSQTQQWTEAIVAFQRAIHLQPESFWSYHNLGYALLQLEQWSDAATAFQQALTLNSAFHWTHYNLGEALVKLADWDGAIAAYQQALDLQPEMPHAQKKLANALQQRAKADQVKALDYYRQAIQQDPDNVQNYHKALEICPKDAELYVQLADALARQSNPAGAVVFYQMAQKLQPDHPTAAQHLEKALQQKSGFPKMLDRPTFQNLAIAPQTSLQPLHQPISNPEIAAENVRLIAFYLPQFHPIPENDLWWGKGFTEWTNVTKAEPLFEGHHQPQLPKDLGFYDLRLTEVREAQAALAQKYGIFGFCYHYYWFAGKRLLHRPLDDMLATQKPDFPFCVCWANENWTRRWDGRDSEVLIAQEYSDEQSQAFAESLIPILQDQRYVRVNGKPLILIYRADILPDPVQATQQWRTVFRNQGIGEVHLCLVLTTFSGLQADCPHPAEWGFDAAVEFPPHGTTGQIVPPPAPVAPDFSGQFFDYREVAINAVGKRLPAFPVFPGVMPAFDNTARRKKAAHAFLNSHPDTYEFWLRGAIEKSKQRFSGEEQLVFINAWNEWAEGAHLEPDQKFGHTYLQATDKAVHGTHSWRTVVNLLRHLPMKSLDQRDRLLNQLEIRVEAIDRSSQVTLHILNALQAHQKAEVISIQKPDQLNLLSNLDSPLVNTLVNLRCIKLDGWVLSQDSKAIAVRIKQKNHLLREVPISIPRSDVAQAYGLTTNQVGFLCTLELSDLTSEIELLLEVVLENGNSQLLRVIQLRQHQESNEELQIIQSNCSQLQHAYSLSCGNLIHSIRQSSLEQTPQLSSIIDELEQAIDLKEWRLDLACDFLKKNPVNQFFESF